MQGGRRTTGPALRIFLWSRAAIWALAAATVLLFDDRLNPARGRWDTPQLHEVGAAVDVLARWDSSWFLQIAADGYAWPSASPAFFPLYPLLTGAVGRLLGGQFVVAGAVVSLAAGTTAFVALYRLALARMDEAGARRTVLFLAVAPMSLFLGVVYSESLFLALAVGCFLAAERGRLGWAAALAGLALLTRPQGLALLPALAVFARQRHVDGTHTAGLLALPAALFLAYPLALWLWVGRPLAFLDAQDQWERELSPFGPFGGVAQALRDTDAVELAFAVAMLALALLAWRQLGAAYGLYSVTVLGLAMSVPSERLGGLYSLPRLSLVAFPCFMALAAVTRRWWQAAAVAAAAAALLGVYVVRWALWYWVS